LYCLALEVFRVERRLSALLPALFFMALFIGMRAFHIGTDTITYVEIYKYVPTITEYLLTFEAGFHGNRMEIGFFLMLSVFKWLTFPPNLVLFIVSFTSLSVLAYAYKKICPNYYLGIFVCSASILFFSLEYNIIRQGIATAFALLALSYLCEGKRLYFVMFTLLAASFHVIALLALFIYPLKRFKWQAKYLLYILPIFIVLGFINVLEVMVWPLRNISVVFWRVFLYLQDSGTALNVISWMLLSTILLISLCVYFVKEIREKYRHIDIILTFVVIGMFGVLFTHELSMLSVRLGYLFFAAEPILILALFSLFKDEYPKYIAIFSLTLLILAKNVFITAQFLAPYDI
jgi:hypothetical protein